MRSPTKEIKNAREREKDRTSAREGEKGKEETQL